MVHRTFTLFSHILLHKNYLLNLSQMTESFALQQKPRPRAGKAPFRPGFPAKRRRMHPPAAGCIRWEETGEADRFLPRGKVMYFYP